MNVANARDAVVFWLWRDMPYRKRMFISFALIILGFLLQWYSGEIFSGVIPLVAGNALLLVRGYDNRVEFKGFDPRQQWQKVEHVRLGELGEFDKKIRRWDRSFIDITNGFGKATFVVLLLVLWMMFLFFTSETRYSGLVVIPMDMAILFLPHWFTGTRRILRMPGLLVKAETLEKVLDEIDSGAPGGKVDVLMLLKGGESKLPEDIKIRVVPEKAPEEFLGLYGQVVINAVQGKSYPYFYAVLVARPGLGLKALAEKLQPPENIVAEFKEKDGVEILVLRQFTTKRSGYHTPPNRVHDILQLGLAQMRALLK